MTEQNRFSGMMGGINSSDKKTQAKATDETKTSKKIESKTTTAKPKSKSADYVQIGVYLPKELHRKMKIGSAISGQEMSAIAQAGIEMWLAENAPNT